MVPATNRLAANQFVTPSFVTTPKDDPKDGLNRLFQSGSSWGKVRNLSRRDNSFNTARSIGTLKASDSPVRINFRGLLDRGDRVDFLKLEIASGAAFNSTRNLFNLRGGNVRVTTYVEIAGAAPDQVDVSRFNPGRRSEVNNSPFSNSFGISIQLIFEVRSLSPARRINYQSTLTFTPPSA